MNTQENIINLERMTEMTKQQAVEYLRNILTNWTTWRHHHETLCQAIETLLEDVKDDNI